MENKDVFSRNLRKLMEQNGKSRRDLSLALGISYYTVSDWVCGKKYPRMDKVELLADYFGVQKSDLIEEQYSAPTLGEGEEALLKLFRSVPTEKQQMVLGMVRAALESTMPDNSEDPKG